MSTDNNKIEKDSSENEDVVNMIKELANEGLSKIMIIERMNEKGYEFTYYRLNKILEPKKSVRPQGRPKGSRNKPKPKPRPEIENLNKVTTSS